MRSFTLAGVRLLTDTGISDETTLTVEDGRVARLGGPVGPKAWRADGLLVLPGIVDLHGDAFERQMMPRPGVHFDTALALLDTDRQLIANGITTAYPSVTYSWEAGLRGRDAGRDLFVQLAALRTKLACDTRLHLRWETFNLDAEDEVAEWLADGTIALMAFNDHTPGMIREIARPDKILKYTERTGLSIAEFTALLEQVYARKNEVAGAIGRLAAIARAANIPMASHDDDSPETRQWFAKIGCTISEFPKTAETARTARAAGHDIVMGAPNVVRGGSHLSAVSAARMVADGLCTILTSDYYYPALLQAPFRLARDGACSLSEAWRLVSENPSRAARLDDRGTIELGKRADLVLVDASRADLPRVAAVIAGGKPILFEGVEVEEPVALRAAS